MRTMYDSITAADIPAGSQLVAGYVDGTFKWTVADWARHAGKVLVRVATSATTADGHVLDVETGDATPLQSVGWVLSRRAAGADPSIYCGAYLWADVRAAFANASVPEPHYWIAQWDNVDAPIVGAIAKQYANSALTGGHYDASVVADFWPGIDGGTMTPDEVKALIAEYATNLETVELLPMKNRLDALEAAPVKQHPHTASTIVS